MAKRKSPTQKSKARVSEDISTPQTERITWGRLKLRYLPLKERLKFIKPDDDDEGD